MKLTYRIINIKYSGEVQKGTKLHQCFVTWFYILVDDLRLSVESDVSVYRKLVTFHLQDTFLDDILDTAGVSHLRERCPPSRVCQRLRHSVTWGIQSALKQSGGSVRVRWDGDVDDKDALVRDAALQGDGGGLHLESHQARPVQSLHGEDDPPARLVSDAKHPAEHARLWLLLEDGERRPVLQNARLGERWQSNHVVVGWNARREGEQLILQEQSWSSGGTVPVTSTVTRPFNETIHKLRKFLYVKHGNIYFMCIFSDSQCEFYFVFLPLWQLTADHEKKGA